LNKTIHVLYNFALFRQMNVNKTWSTIPVLYSACPLLLVDDLQRGLHAPRCNQDDQDASGHAGRGCRAKRRRPNIRTGWQHEVNSAAKCVCACVAPKWVHAPSAKNECANADATKSCVSWNSSLFRDALLESNI
jgi:hypothetical protein